MQKIIQTPENFNGIMIVGEAPGKDEMRLHTPFVGVEGQYLRGRLKKGGVDPADCYLTNTVHQQPTRNIYDTLPKDALDFGCEELIKAIHRCDPTLILAVGSRALTMLTGKVGIFKYRGAITRCELVDGYKVLPTVHPGNIFRSSSAVDGRTGKIKIGNAKYDIILQMDINKAVKESKFKGIKQPQRTIEVIRTVSSAVSILDELSHSTTPHAVDIETGGPLLIAYGIAISPKFAYVVPKSLLEIPIVLRSVSEYAASQAPKMFHNLLYDVFHNAYYYHILNNNIYFDTMLAQHAIFPTLPKSLAFCASIYTNEVYWKDEGKVYIKSTNMNKITDWENFYIYNGKDCCVTYEIYEKQKEELTLWNTWEAFNLMMRMTKPALYAMMTGIRINTDKVAEFKEQNEKVIANLDTIKNAVIGDVNIASPKQLKKLLYDDWKLPVQKIHGKVTTEAKKLRRLETYPVVQKPLLGLIRSIKKYTKMRDFYRLVLDPDGNVRFSAKLHGTITGRWSTSKCITGSGLNLQQQPVEVRDFYVADPGKIFVERDLSNAEARIVAACCEDKEWLNRFDVEDQHTFVASQLFNVPMEEVTLSQRNDYAKKIAHASHYLLGWKLLSEILLCSAKEAKQHKANYYKLRPSLDKWHKSIENVVGKTRVIRTCFNRAIQFFGPNFGSMMSSAVAVEPQSTCGDYLNYSLVNVYEQVPEAEFKLQVHDSVLEQLPDDLIAIESIIKKEKEITEIPITVHGLTFTIPVAFKIGYDWKNMKKIKDIDNIKPVYETLQISRTI